MKLKFLLEDETNSIEEIDASLGTEDLVSELNAPIENEVMEEATEDEVNAEVFTEPVDEQIDFIDSDELNEIREILLDVPDDLSLLLLDDDCIIISTEEDGVTKLATLTDESDDFLFIDLPNEKEKIINNDLAIKYTPEGPDSRHSKVVDILMKKLEDTPEETEVEEIIEEPEKEEDENE